MTMFKMEGKRKLREIERKVDKIKLEDPTNTTTTKSYPTK